MTEVEKAITVPKPARYTRNAITTRQRATKDSHSHCVAIRYQQTIPPSSRNTTQTHTPSVSLSLSLSVCLSFSLSLSLYLSLSHTHTHTHARTQARTHARTHTQSPCAIKKKSLNNQIAMRVPQYDRFTATSTPRLILCANTNRCRTTPNKRRP